MWVFLFFLSIVFCATDAHAGPAAPFLAAALPYISLAVGVVSAGFGVMGSLAQAKQSQAYGQQMSAYYQQMAEQQKMSAEMQAKAMEANADIAEMEAQSIIGQTQQETLKLSRERRKLLGAQAALYGGAGVSLIGSPLDVMADTAAGFEQDIQLVGYGGDIKMRSKLYESELDKWMAENARLSGSMQAQGTSLLADAALQQGESEYWGNMFKAGTGLFEGISGAASSFGKLFPSKKPSEPIH